MFVTQQTIVEKAIYSSDPDYSIIGADVIAYVLSNENDLPASLVASVMAYLSDPEKASNLIVEVIVEMLQPLPPCKMSSIQIEALARELLSHLWFGQIEPFALVL